MEKTKREDLLFPELSYEIIGAAFNVFNDLGPGHPEIIYQKGMELVLSQNNLKFERQVYAPVYFKGKVIGKSFLDLLIDEKIVVELKKGSHFSKINIDQVLKYLRATDRRLGIIINFSNEGVKFKRIINIY